MKANIGQPVSANQFFKAVDQAFGKNAHRRMNISCSNGNLVDIYINLPAVIPENASVSDLIQKAPEAFENRCGDRFVVDEIGFRSN